MCVWANGSEDGDPNVTIWVDLEPGDRIAGRTYEEWAALEEGWHPVAADWDPAKDYPTHDSGVPELRSARRLASEAPEPGPSRPESQPGQARALQGRAQVELPSISDAPDMTPEDEAILERLAALVAARRAKAPQAELKTMQVRLGSGGCGACGPRQTARTPRLAA